MDVQLSLGQAHVVPIQGLKDCGHVDHVGKGWHDARRRLFCQEVGIPGYRQQTQEYEAAGDP